MIANFALPFEINLAESTVSKLTAIAVTITVAWIVYMIIRVTIKRTSRSIQSNSVQERIARFRKRTSRILLETNQYDIMRRTQRAETIASMLTSVVAVVICITSLLIILKILEINATPLLTSTAVIGAAIAFGAQNVIRDFLTGFFIVTEDQYGVGDFISLGNGEAKGTVESVSLRLTRLRDSDGTLWQVPNGEIKQVGNHSQSWSRSLTEFRVNLNHDVDRVTELALEAANKVCSDEEFRPLILDAPEIWSPDSIDNDGILFKIIIKTRPLAQWKVSRGVRKKVKEVFDDQGIVFSSSFPRIYGGEDVDPYSTIVNNSNGEKQ